MRGTLKNYLDTVQSLRITPAHAGNTSLLISSIGGVQDHPRPCGEHSSEQYFIIASLGSPPPMRGTQFGTVLYNRFFRITPAHAGNTMIKRIKVKNIQDHPRPCGEHSGIKYTIYPSLGSPPPMRGTQHG